MNNDEKALNILTQMQDELKTINQRLGSLEKSQAAMQADLTAVKEQQLKNSALLDRSISKP